MTQKGLLERIIKALNLDDAKGKSTSAVFGALSKDKHGEPMNGTFNYVSVIGMLLYLRGHTRSDLAFAVSECA